MCNARRKLFACFVSAKNACGFVASLRFSLVLNVCALRHVSQIFKSVVVFDAINMVYLARRPLPCHIQPRKSMALITFFIHRSDKIAFCGAAARYCAAQYTSLFHFPRKCAFMRVIIKHLFEAFLAQHVKTIPNFYGVVK